MGIYWDFERFGSATALIADTGATLTYRELASLSDEADAGMREGGADGTNGRLVMFICRNTTGAIAGYAALMNKGYPVLPCSAESDGGRRRALMNIYRPGFLLLPKEMCGEYPTMKTVWEIRDYAVLKTNYSAFFPVHAQLGLLITTSGSTGSAKFVRQSRENLRFNAAAIADALGIGPSDKTITELPLQYTYGLSVLHANLLRGAAMVVTQSGVMDNEFWDLFENEEVTCFHGVPTTYEMLRHIELFEDDFPSLRTMSQAGGRLSRELQEYYGRYAGENGKRFIIMYGQSEATAAISRLEQEDILRKPGSVGKVIPGGSVHLADEAGHPITEAHQPGELVYCGPNVAMGYALRGEDLQLGDEWNGMVKTGDIAEFDEEGYLFITGRLKRFIKMAGHRISLDEIDSLIMDELNIRSVSVGEDEHLTVFVTDGREKELVEAFVPSRISTVRNGFRVMTIPAFPQNEGGKILYAELQAAAGKGTTSAFLV